MFMHIFSEYIYKCLSIYLIIYPSIFIGYDKEKNKWKARSEAKRTPLIVKRI